MRRETVTIEVARSDREKLTATVICRDKDGKPERLRIDQAVYAPIGNGLWDLTANVKNGKRRGKV